MIVVSRSRPTKPAFFKKNPQLYITPLATENNTKEGKRQRQKGKREKVKRTKTPPTAGVGAKYGYLCFG